MTASWFEINSGALIYQPLHMTIIRWLTEATKVKALKGERAALSSLRECLAYSALRE